MAIVVNLFAYQLGWLACVLGAADQMPLLGTGVALAIVTLHVARAGDPAAELKLVASVAGVGLVTDTALAAIGVLTFASGALGSGVTSHWMIALWMLFATTLNVSLRWLKNRAVLAVIFGALGGPLAYLAGAKLDALQLQPLGLGLTAVGIGWAIAMWLLALLARRFDGIVSFAPAAAGVKAA